MPREYELKRPVLTKNRAQKIGKKILKDCDEDRLKALALYDDLKRGFKEGKESITAKDLNDALKLAQSSKVNAIKTIELLAKLEMLGDSKTKETPTKKKDMEDIFADMRG